MSKEVHIVIDLETLSTKENAHILSIGAASLIYDDETKNI